jgi:environmental stress-induced protein Ves
MRRFTPADYRRMPWRNGGGTTTELVIGPEGAALSAAVAGERFLYRVSIADVASDGPFSRFAGYDRHIMLLDGAGMTLDCGPHGRIDLHAPFVPRAFSGDWDVAGALVGGAVRDFNLMVDRSRATSTLEVAQLEAPRSFAPGARETCIVHVVEGALDGGAEGDTLVVGTPFELVPRTKTRLVIARIVLLP